MKIISQSKTENLDIFDKMENNYLKIISVLIKRRV